MSRVIRQGAFVWLTCATLSLAQLPAPVRGQAAPTQSPAQTPATTGQTPAAPGTTGTPAGELKPNPGNDKPAPPGSKTAPAAPLTPAAPSAPGSTAPAASGNPPATKQIPSDVTGQPPIILPVNTTSAGQKQTPTQERYGVPRTPQVGTDVDLDLTKPLTLERAIGIGLRNQNTIAISQAQTDSANQRITIARSQYFPQISPSFNYVSTLRPTGAFVINGQTFNTSNTSGGSNNTSSGTGTNTSSGGTTSGGSTGGSSSGGSTTSGNGGSSTSGTGSTTVGGGSTGGGSTGTGGVSGGSSGSGSTTPVVVGGGSTFSNTTTQVVGLSQLIYDSGKREANLGLARRNAFAAEYGLGNERQNVIYNVAQSYLNLIRSQELVRVQSEAVRRAQTTLESIQAQVQVGNAAASDTLQAEADLANARVNLLQAQSDVNVNQSTLKNAMGVVISPPLVLADERLPAPAPDTDPTSVDQYTNMAYERRLDRKQQQELVNAQGYNVRIAQINNGLTTSVTLNEGYQFSPSAGEQRTFFLNASFPLFDAGSTRAAVREAKASQEQQRRTLDQLEQSIRFNVEQAYLIREQARQRATLAAVAVRAGQLNYDAALAKQQNGLINIIDVINAEFQLINAQVSEVQAIYDFYIADARLQRNVGNNDPNYTVNLPGRNGKVVKNTTLKPGMMQARALTAPFTREVAPVSSSARAAQAVASGAPSLSGEVAETAQSGGKTVANP